MSPLPNPLMANMAAANPPALGTSIAMPGPAPSMGASVLPSVSLAPPPPPTQTQLDITKRNDAVNKGSGIDQIHNPLLRGIARAADIAGSVFAPNLAQFIPGTTLHHQLVVNQMGQNVAKDQAEEQATATTAGTQARTAQEQASTEATTEQTAAGKRAAAKAAMSGNILYDENKNPIGYQDPTGRMMGIHDQALPPNVQDILSSVKGKSPTSEFELWHQQNPNGTAQDFQKVQSKPLTSDQATSLNNVWDALADKHHLPKGQFKEGMSGSDATQLQTALNNAVGKQQGDSHVSISLQGLQNQQAKNASLDTSDPAMQASVNAVANGSMKLADVFGRGATTAQKAQFAAAVKAVNPNYNSGDHDIENAVRRDFTSGHDSDTVNAINTAYNHLDKFAAAAQSLKGGSSKAMNEMANALGVQFQKGASPQIISDLVKQALKGEVSRAFTGAGATVDEQRNLDSSFSNANSLDTMLGVVSEAKGLLKGKETNLQNKFNSGTQGKPNFIGDNAPKDGDTKTNSHGDKIAFHGGKWGPA